jgi:2'-5' RNA ligase
VHRSSVPLGIGLAGVASVAKHTSTLQDRAVIHVLAYPVFDPGSAERIDAFRARHEPERARLVPPHVTLVFGVSDEHLPTVSGLVDMVSGRTRVFPVVFDTAVIAFDDFEKTHKVFLLCGDGSERIKALHEQLYSGEHRSELSSAHPFEPHMTVASHDTRSEMEQIDVSAIGDFPIRADVPALKLVQVYDGRLTVLKTASFMV